MNRDNDDSNRPRLELYITHSSRPSRQQAISHGGMVIGRVDDSDVVLSDASVSKRHTHIGWRNGRPVITDLQSENGTWINRKRVATPVIVRAGDTLQIGHFAIKIRVATTPAIGLRVINSAGIAEDLGFEGPEVTLGRHSLNEIPLMDPCVGRRHTRFTLGGGALTVADLKSANGTLVNGRQISTPTIVRPGDEITLGQTKVQVTVAPPPPPRQARGGPSSIREFICNDSLWEDLQTLVGALDRSPDSVIASAIEKYLEDLD